MRIGLCDSGLGGLAVLKELKLKYPNNDYIYIGDNQNLPYGNKSKEELTKLGQNLIDFLNEKKVDLIIIACGTLSSNVLEKLISKVKIIDIISPTIEHINQKIKKKVTVFATEATINTHIFKNQLIYGCTEIACPEFVPMIENNCINKNVIINKIPNKDPIVLGCTHYGIIEKLIPNKTINMGKLINLKENKGTSKIDIYFTKIDDKLMENVKKIIDGEVKYARITRS